MFLGNYKEQNEYENTSLISCNFFKSRIVQKKLQGVKDVYM